MIEPTRETRAYWEALADGRLIAERCTSCGKIQSYPRRFCEQCGAEGREPIELGGRGTIHTFSLLSRAPRDFYLEPPFAVALVELNCGYRLLAPIIGDDVQQLSIGDTVELAPVPNEDLVMPCFRRSAKEHG